jgi:hypothetical protein
MRTRLLLALLMLWGLLPGPSWAVVSCGTAATSTTEADPQTLAFTPDAGSNRVAIIAVGWRDSVTPTNTVNGATSSAGGTWTQYDLQANPSSPASKVALFYSTDFADGAQTVSVDYSAGAPTQGTVGAFTCTGVNTASPWRDTSTTNSGTATSGSNVISSAVGDIVIDVLSLSGNTGDSLTVGAGQTEFFNLSNGGVNLFTGSSREAGAASVTMSWSWVNSRGWVSIGGSLVPAGTSAFGPLRRRD